MPPADKFWPFVFSGGKLDAKPVISDVLSLERLFANYEQSRPVNGKEESTTKTDRIHKNHLLRILGGRTSVRAPRRPELHQRPGEGKEREGWLNLAGDD